MIKVLCDYADLIIGLIIGIIVNNFIIKPIERRKIRNEILRKQEKEGE